MRLGGDRRASFMEHVSQPQLEAVIDAGSGARPESGPREGRPKRRSFTGEYKRRIVAEYDAAAVGHKGQVLRRERLYDSHVMEWRAQIVSGSLESPPKKGRPGRTVEQARIAELERQVKRLEGDNALKDEVIASKEAALEVLGKGVAFLEALSSRNAR
jgi:transposase